MDGLSTALAVNQAMTQNLIGLAVAKMALQSQQQVATMLAQAAAEGQALASNPAHLGQMLDTRA